MSKSVWTVASHHQWVSRLVCLNFSSDGDDGVITHDDRLRGMVIKQGDMVSFVADNLNEQIKLSSPSQSGKVTTAISYSTNPERTIHVF